MENTYRSQVLRAESSKPTLDWELNLTPDQNLISYMKLHEGGYVELLCLQVNQGKTILYYCHLGLEPKCAACLMLPEQRANI